MQICKNGRPDDGKTNAIHDHCQSCGCCLIEGEVEWIDDYGIIMCENCLAKNKNARNHIDYMFSTDPVEDDHRL